MANISHSVILSSLLAGSCLAAENLGIIGIDSTTIDDRFHSSRTEASSTSTIDGQKVDDSHVENIQQVLNAIPGITTEVKTGDSLKIHIRGIENQVYMGEKPGVAVVIDGVPVFERTGAVNIDLDNIESIKVIKGGLRICSAMTPSREPLSSPPKEGPNTTTILQPSSGEASATRNLSPERDMPTTI